MNACIFDPTQAYVREQERKSKKKRNESFGVVTSRLHLLCSGGHFYKHVFTFMNYLRFYLCAIGKTVKVYLQSFS